MFQITVFVVMFAGCPLIWASKRQTETALSMAENKSVPHPQLKISTIYYPYKLGSRVVGYKF